jgi:hypothetical protein
VASSVVLTQAVGQSDADWYTELANKGVTQFRYTATTPEFEPGAITVTFLQYDEANNGEGWRDSADNRSIEGLPNTFFVEGPTVNLVSPGSGGQIDIGVLMNRGYIDVTWAFGGVGYRLDTNSITDLAPEFVLGGAGLGTVKLDNGQAPVLLSDLSGNPSSVTYRYWTTGNYAATSGTDDTVDISFIAGSWSFTEAAAPASPTATATLTNAQWLTVNFDAVVPAGFVMDPGRSPTWRPSSASPTPARMPPGTAPAPSRWSARLPPSASEKATPSVTASRAILPPMAPKASR